MDCNELYNAAEKVIVSIDTQTPQYSSINVLTSIKNHMAHPQKNQTDRLITVLSGTVKYIYCMSASCNILSL